MGRYIFRRKALVLSLVLLPACLAFSLYAAEGATHYHPLDIPGAEHHEVEKYRQQFLSPYGREWLKKILTDAEPYRRYIRRKLREENLPACLEYLPVVESEYKPSAASKSGAKGMWQFMANSMAPFLTKNEWVDERLDPWKSTDAALAKLKDNYNMFGDWPLAIAAYNCGAGALSRIVKKSGKKTFWELTEGGLLNRQVSEYVPKFLAVADLVRNADYYGIELPDFESGQAETSQSGSCDFDYVTVDSQVSLRRLASELRIDDTFLKSLNPSLLHDVTPPDTSYRLRVPQGFSESAGTALRTIKKQHPGSGCFSYTVVRGDSLWAISRRYGIKLADLCLINGLSEKNILSVGKILYIPAKITDK
ncbi:MAG: transglycosylase SLT domain-containing protein [Treponema sp.]|jgi:membrane-bound lytic murein transglycosylase D|nr:transglycosylase SLT domain-containing protein [Treponema sp.]